MARSASAGLLVLGACSLAGVGGATGARSLVASRRIAGPHRWSVRPGEIRPSGRYLDPSAPLGSLDDDELTRTHGHGTQGFDMNPIRGLMATDAKIEPSRPVSSAGNATRARRDTNKCSSFWTQVKI